MSTEEQKTELLDAFQTYLQTDQHGAYAPNEQPDLKTLLSELTSLKTEVKVESRQYKSTLDTLSAALESLKIDNQALSAELGVYSERLVQQRMELMRPMLLDMVDIYDRISTGVDVLRNYQPVNALFKHSRKKDVRFIERFKEGQLMTIRRFEQLLQSYQVRAIDTVGKMLDPTLMNAVETGQKNKLENGIVLQELRKGFLYQDQVLRLAEVKVNKTKAG